MPAGVPARRPARALAVVTVLTLAVIVYIAVRWMQLHHIHFRLPIHWKL
jgi:hypothetical protein